MLWHTPVIFLASIIMADDGRCSTRPPARIFAAAPARPTQRVVGPVPPSSFEGNATPAPRRRPSTQEPAGRPSDTGIQRQDRSTGNNRDLKVLALNYFCDSILQSHSFQDCIKLCYDCEDMWSWFEAFVVCDDVDIIRLFHVIVRRLF